MQQTADTPAPQRIVVIGLGRVGLVNAACLAAHGHSVIGVDRSSKVVDTIENGDCPFHDQPLAQLLRKLAPTGRMRATTCIDEAMPGADIINCCVGSPVGPDGEVDLTQLRVAANAIGRALPNAARGPVIMLRSTVPPRTTSDIFKPILERQSGLVHGTDFQVAYVPEFLREGSAVHDFEHATRSVIGVSNAAVFDRLSALFAPFSERLMKTSLELAELAKLTDNAWHSLKVSFANELGNIAVAAGQDGQQLLDLLCLDSKLNMSSAYLKPGFAFGGPCLPKDLKMIKAFAGQYGVATPVLKGAEQGNDVQIERARQLVLKQRTDRVTLIGPQFKSGTNRLTGSPALELIARLQQDGIQTRISAGDALAVQESREPVIAETCSLVGNRTQYATSLRDAAAFAELIIIGCVNSEDRAELQGLLRDKTVLDIVGWPELERFARNYIGVNWLSNASDSRDASSMPAGWTRSSTPHEARESLALD